MKALRKLGKGAESVQLCEVEKPIPGPNDLLVKVMAAGICGTDLHILAEEYSHSVPVTLGHEYTGVVEQVGSGVTDFQVGDQVISVSIAYSCGTCHYCRKGDPVHCTQKASIGVNVDGAMAEYMVIPADSAMKVPEQYKGSDILALSEPIACVYPGGAGGVGDPRRRCGGGVRAGHYRFAVRPAGPGPGCAGDSERHQGRPGTSGTGQEPGGGVGVRQRR